LRLGVLALAYFILAVFGLRLAVPGTNATAIWIPTGLAIAGTLRFGQRVWPAILVGAFAANAMLLSRLGLAPMPLVGAALAAAVGNVIEALLAGFLVWHFTGTRHPFDRVAHVLTFILVAGVLGPMLSALMGTASFCAATGHWGLFRTMGAAWWVGDGVAALVVAPLLLTIRWADLAALPAKVHRDALLASALVVAFWFWVCPLFPLLAFLFFPLLVLGTARLGPCYASALVVLLTFLATTATLWGIGPFALPGDRTASLLLQQGFIATLAITTLVLAAAFQERMQLEARLRVQNRLYRTLSDVNQIIVHAEDRAGLLAQTCGTLVETGGFNMAYVGFMQASGFVVPEASAGFDLEQLARLAIRWDESPAGQGVVGRAIRAGKGVMVRDCLTDPDYVAWRHLAVSLDFRTCCAFPVRRAGVVSGVLVIAHRDAQAFSTEDVGLLEELAGDLSYALEALETRKELAESERRFRSTLANVNLLAITLDADASIRFCNDFTLQLTGWTLAEVLGHNWFERFVPPEQRREVESVLAVLSNPGESASHHENEILTRSGERRLIRWSNTLLRDREAMNIGSICLGEDITDQRQAEVDLLKRATQLGALNTLMTQLNTNLELSACGQAAVDGCLAAAAPDQALLFLREGESLQLLAAASALENLRQGDRPAHQLGECLCGLAARDGVPLYSVDLVADRRCATGDCRQAGVQSFAVLPLTHGEEILGVLGLASASPRDFSSQSTFLETLAAQVSVALQNALLHQRVKAHAADLERCVEQRTAMLREANEDLVKAVEHAQAADRAKSAFLSAMSHELRTPLNSVIGFTGALLGGLAGNLQPQQEEPLRIVQRNGRHLLDLINDVLDLSKIEAEEMRMAAQPFDLVPTLRESLESLTPAAAAKGLTLRQDFALDSLPVTGDRRRVSQILLNLISNAVKFTETGSVLLRLSVAGSQARIAVQDTGPGIPARDLPRLFREFEQLDAGLARRNEGTGLGLALSRRLARLMNGDIVVESQPGLGSTFTFLLPT
jgi:PAS domain S-box-containing protein